MRDPVATNFSARALYAAGLVLLTACQPTPQTASVPLTESGSEPTHVVASWSGGRVTQADLESRVLDRLRDMDIRYRIERYDLLSRTLDAVVEEALLERAAASAGVHTIEDLLAAEVDAKTPEPTEAELRREFAAFAQRVPGATFEEARSHLANELRRVKREDRHREFIEALRARSDLQMRLPYPETPRIDVPLRDHDPAMGPADAPVTIVQFAEYQCYFCSRMAPVLSRLVDAYEGKVRIVFKDFPLRAHGRARDAAVAAHCAGRQDRYWQLGERLFDLQGRLGDQSLHDLAVDAGLDLLAWEDCRQEPSWSAAIDEDLRDGHAAGVTSTPTLFINGRMVSGAHPYERVAGLVDQELARSRR